MKKGAFILLASFLLCIALNVGASYPLSVNVQVEQTYVKEGDTVQVTWTVNGGTPPYTSWIYWDDIWTEDTLIGNYGNQYHSVFSVRPGMKPLLSFRIETNDESVYSNNPLIVHSSDLGYDIVNLDGWTSPGSTRIELNSNRVYKGETIIANVFRIFDASIDGYNGFQYQWVITDANGKTTYTEMQRISDLQQYNTVLNFTPTNGVSGYLKVIAYEPKYTDDTTTKTYNSETFTILDGAQNGIAPIQNPFSQNAVRSYTPASLNQRMATRSGPGTQYTEELGTLPQETEIKLLESVNTGVPWGLVEFYRNGVKVRAYTGMKCINAYGPVAKGTQDYYEVVLSRDTEVYYGPGYDYGQRKDSVRSGTVLRVYGSENDFMICDYQSGKEWVRAYFPLI